MLTGTAVCHQGHVINLVRCSRINQHPLVKQESIRNARVTKVNAKYHSL